MKRNGSSTRNDIMKTGKRISVNFEEQEDQLWAQQIEINVKNAPVPGRASAKPDGVNSDQNAARGLAGSQPQGDRRCTIASRAIHVCFVFN